MNDSSLHDFSMKNDCEHFESAKENITQKTEGCEE